MVRDPSIVSPSLTGVFIGGGHNKHGTYRIEVHAAKAVSSPLSPTTRGACSAGSGVVRCTTSLGLRSPYDASRHRHRLGCLCGIEPLRDGQAHQFSFRFSPAPAGDSERVRNSQRAQPPLPGPPPSVSQSENSGVETRGASGRCPGRGAVAPRPDSLRRFWRAKNVQYLTVGGKIYRPANC